MANYNNLKAGIDAVIKTNGRQEISGAALNAQLKNMISELGAGYQYMGVATPATNPGTPDANVFYLASEAGTYTNFGGIVINEGEVCVLAWNGTWTKQVTGIATADQLNQLGQIKADKILLTTNWIDNKYVKSDGTLGNSEGYKATDYIKVIPCEGIAIRTKDDYSASYIAFYKDQSETTFIESIAITNSELAELVENVPANANYVRFTRRTTVPEADSYIYIKNYSGSIEDLFVSVNNFRYLTPTFYENYGYIKISNGAFTPWSDNTTVATDYIPIRPGKTIRIYARNFTAGVSGLAFYDEDKQFIPNSGESYSASEFVYITVTPPSNAYYVRFTCLDTNNHLKNKSTFENLDAEGIINDVAENRIDIINLKKDVGYDVESLSLIDNSGYYISIDGTKRSFSDGHYSDPISIQKGQTIEYSNRGNEGVAMISLTDSLGSTYIPVVIGDGSATSSYPQTVQYTAQEDGYVAVCGFNSIGSATLKTPGDLPMEIFELDQRVDKLENKEVINLIATFDNIVCAGDSLTYSQVFTGDNTSRQAKRPYPNVLAGICGNTATILARGGNTAKTCWDEFGSQIVSKDNAIGIIYLGTNLGISDTLDTDVVGDNPDNWADNNPGCYCRIVQKMQAAGYKVLLVKIWATSGYDDGDAHDPGKGYGSLATTNSAIEHIGERFGCAVLDSFHNQDDVYHYYPDLTGTNTVHYNDLGYTWFANKIIEMVGILSGDMKKLLIPNA